MSGRPAWGPGGPISSPYRCISSWGTHEVPKSWYSNAWLTVLLGCTKYKPLVSIGDVFFSPVWERISTNIKSHGWERAFGSALWVVYLISKKRSFYTERLFSTNMHSLSHAHGVWWWKQDLSEQVIAHVLSDNHLYMTGLHHVILYYIYKYVYMLPLTNCDAPPSVSWSKDGF